MEDGYSDVSKDFVGRVVLDYLSTFHTGDIYQLGLRLPNLKLEKIEEVLEEQRRTGLVELADELNGIYRITYRGLDLVESEGRNIERKIGEAKARIGGI